MTHGQFLRALLACAAGLLVSAAAQAQAFRTYLSSTGVDNAACGLLAPCRLLPAALAAVANGGEVWMLDSANYNTSPVNVDKSVTILAVPGALGSVLALGGNAINIAAPRSRVTLRNLVIVPLAGGGGTNGIAMTEGEFLTVENCVIANLPQSGIVVSTTGSGGTPFDPVTINVRVTDTTIRDNASHGLNVQDGSLFTTVTVTRATISGNGGNGVLVEGGNQAHISDSTMSANLNGLMASGNGISVSVFRSKAVGNTAGGLVAQSAGGSVTLVVSNSAASNNATGIAALNAGSRVIASGNTVIHNTLGLQNSAGVFESASDNAVRNNTSQTSGTITPIPKI